MTGCGFAPDTIDQMTLFDVMALFRYWQDTPPTHEVLKHVYRLERKPAASVRPDAGDPSGIGALVARYPSGNVRDG